MTSKRPPGLIVILALGLALVLGSGFYQPARAASEDVAMFYDDLSQYGQWVDYENYGPVWRPSNVDDQWRPYTDGRWVPTDDGYVFESQEPWGWATYHYGNWMPTEGYGWVWTPGRTWYPSTVEWRTSPETAQVDNSYVGWAPVPPPDYVPTQSYAAPGYYQGAPAADTMSSPFWVFVRAASFLLGLGQPYAPAYSYGGCGCMAPPAYVPVFFPQTVFVPSYYTPSYYPRTYFGRGFAGAYSYGPPVSYISRVTNINQTVINRTIINNSNNFSRIHNVMPPQAVLTRNAGLRQITPPALMQGQRLPPAQRLTNVSVARANLGKPNIIHAPQNVPPLRAQIPKAPPLAAQPVRGGVPGAGLPSRATMQLTPQQQGQIQQLPPNQQIRPVRPSLAGQPAAPGAPVRPGQFQPGAAPHPGAAQPGVTGRPGQFQPGAPVQPGAAQSGVTGRPGQVQTAPGRPGQFQPGAPGHPAAQPAVPAQPGGPAHPGTFQPGAPSRPQVQPSPGYKPPTSGPGYVRPGTPAQPTPSQPLRPQPQPQRVTPQYQQPQPQHVTPQYQPAQPRPQPQMQPRPQPQPQVQPRPQPQPQMQPRPQPQVQRPQPAPQPQRVAPAPQPRPQAAPAAKPQPQPQQQKKEKKPGEQ